MSEFFHRRNRLYYFLYRYASLFIKTIAPLGISYTDDTGTYEFTDACTMSN
ncbi:MAG: hypothetical protein IKB05_00300 [Alphaproteobacteria bacterium]|nr:hypothetical protein [Alphaproteobacteria bacterium]